VIQRQSGLLVKIENSRHLYSGVLTKADVVQEGDHGQWLQILNNESHVLRRGYFATRLPGTKPQEEALSWERVRELERKFFKKSPWSEADKKRLGTERLIEALSNALLGMIKEK
jgi:hypothetical protein